MPTSAGDDLNNFVHERSDAWLRSRLQDKSITWDQRKAIINELCNRAIERGAPEGEVRYLQKQFEEGKLPTGRPADDFARHLGISWQDIYNRPKGDHNENGKTFL